MKTSNVGSKLPVAMTKANEGGGGGSPGATLH
jgi:hypothetical protein